MQIGQLARLAGVSVDTVRFYERQDLLPAPVRQSSGYRVYADDDVQRLRFIRRAKALGFSLDETRQLLVLSAPGGDVAQVKDAAREKLRDVEERMAELRKIQDGLQQLVDACPGHGPQAACPILSALAGDDGDGDGETTRTPR